MPQETPSQTPIAEYVPSYERYGAKKAVVLVHGLSEVDYSWPKTIEPLAKDFTVYVVDLFRYDSDDVQSRGGLDVDEITRRLTLILNEEIKEPSVTLAGSSLGGQSIIKYAAKYPEKVEKIILLASSGLGEDEGLPHLSGVKKDDVRNVVASVFYHQKMVNEEAVSLLQDRYQNRKWKKGLIRTANKIKDNTVTDLIPLVQAPTLLVWGEEDYIVEIDYAYKALPLFKQGKMVVIPKCGHAPHVEFAWSTNRIIKKFIRGEAPFREEDPQILRLSRTYQLKRSKNKGAGEEEDTFLSWAPKALRSMAAKPRRIRRPKA